MIEHRAIAEHKPIPESRLSIMSFKFEELVGPTLLIGKGREVFTKVLLNGKKFVMYVYLFLALLPNVVIALQSSRFPYMIL